MSTLEDMAREAGLDIYPGWLGTWEGSLERFAALVRADERAKALDEAAATAKSMELGRPGHTTGHDVVLYRGMVDAAILALKDRT